MWQKDNASLLPQITAPHLKGHNETFILYYGDKIQISGTGIFRLQCHPKYWNPKYWNFHNHKTLAVSHRGLLSILYPQLDHISPGSLTLQLTIASSYLLTKHQKRFTFFCDCAKKDL